MRQFWPRVGFVLTAAVGFLITVMDPKLPLLESLQMLTGIQVMGLLMVVIPAFSSPTQVGEIVEKVSL